MLFSHIKSFTFTAKILVLFSTLIIGLMLTLIINGLSKISHLSEFTQKIYQHPLVVSNSVQTVNSNIISMHRYMKDVSIAKNTSELDKAVKKVALGQKIILKEFGLIYKQFLGDKNRITKLRNQFIAWEEIRNEVIALAKNKKNDQAAAITKGKGQVYVESLISNMDDILLFARNKATEFLESSKKEYRNIRNELILSGLIVIIVSFIAVIFIFKKVTTDEKKLIDNEERFRIAFESVSIGNIVINSKGIIQVYNSAAQEIFGYSPDEVVGKNVTLLMPDDFKKHHDMYLKRYLETGEAHIIGAGREVTGLRANGEQFPMHLGIGEMRVGDDILFIASINDLTDDKKILKQLNKKQRMEAIGQLTGGIAHDFNNLLAIMMGNLELALEKTKNDKTLNDNIENTLTAVQKGAALTQHLLFYAGQQNLNPQVMESGQAITETVEFLNRTLSENIQIVSHVSNEKLPILIDASVIGSVFLNITINSRDAMPNGGVISIKNELIESQEIETHFDNVKPGKYVKISISDSGTGMDQVTINHVFEPFYTTKDIGEGSGLGLSMVYGFIQQSNGYIEIKSKKNIGTTVFIYLPLAEDDLELAESVQSQPKFSFRNKSILLVEDDFQVAETTATTLRELDFTVLIATNAKEAIELLKDKNNNIGLLISDIVMPGSMNGIELANHARNTYHKLTILLISGYPDVIANKAKLEQEKLTLLPKPFTRNQLLQAIEDVSEGTSWEVK